LSKLTEERISGEEVFRGSFLRLYRDQVRLPDGSQTVREYLRHPGAVLIAPLLADGRVVLERQFRYPHGREFIELPAGKREEGEAPLVTAQRELLEETGYAAGQWTRLGIIHNAIGYSNEGIEMYVAQDLEKREARLDAGEFLEELTVPLAEAVAMVRDGRITDAKTVSALLWVDKWVSIRR